eukprot:3285931-Rhodomonas_salina.2
MAQLPAQTEAVPAEMEAAMAAVRSEEGGRPAYFFAALSRHIECQCRTSHSPCEERLGRIYLPCRINRHKVPPCAGR